MRRLVFGLVVLAACSKPRKDEPGPIRATKVERPEGDFIGCFLWDQRRDDPKLNVEPTHVDCPTALRRPGDPPEIKRRPPGKEAWLRETYYFGYDAAAKSCSYEPEGFCAPPTEIATCVRAPSVNVPCRELPPEGTSREGPLAVEAFVWRDGLGHCHQAPARTCSRYDCTPPESPEIACPASPDH